jgi:endonuclease YncB( thermonuclease family)
MKILFMSISLLFSSVLFAETDSTIIGFVTQVYDGDTATVVTCDGIIHKIRLAKIDAPELKQAYGKESKWCLSEKIANKRVTVHVFNKDLYQREVGELFLDEKSINTQLVQEGCAWVYEAYNKDMSLIDTQARAKVLKKGLWSDSQPIAPWEYRKNR